MYQIAVGLLLGQGIILLGATVLAILMCLGAECTWDWDYVFRPVLSVLQTLLCGTTR